MHILLGLINAIVIIFLDYLIMAFTDFSVRGLGILYVLPVGAILEGALCSYLLFKFIKKLNIKIAKKHYIIAALLALFTFWGSQYAYYASTYIKGDNVNNKFQGEHISNYMYNDTEVFTFGNYLKYNLENQTITSKVNRNPHSLGKGYNIFRFGISMLGFIIGGLGLGLGMMKGLIYCDRCKKYMGEKELFRSQDFSVDEEMNLFQEVLKDTKDKVQEFLAKKGPLKSNSAPYVQASIIYCSACYDGYLQFKRMVPKKDSKGKITWEEDALCSKKVHITAEMTEMIL